MLWIFLFCFSLLSFCRREITSPKWKIQQIQSLLTRVCNFVHPLLFGKQMLRLLWSQSDRFSLKRQTIRDEADRLRRREHEWRKTKRLLLYSKWNKPSLKDNVSVSIYSIKLPICELYFIWLTLRIQQWTFKPPQRGSYKYYKNWFATLWKRSRNSALGLLLHMPLTPEWGYYVQPSSHKVCRVDYTEPRSCNAQGVS